MKRQIKKQVIDTLLCNLKILRRDIQWDIQHPLVKEFIHHMDEESRAYHGWDHLNSMLEEFKNFCLEKVHSPLRLIAAILFHDSVYRAGASNNKEQSAYFARKFYRGDDLAEIVLLISATRHAFPFIFFGDDRDTLCDLDLADLGAPIDVFMQNMADIKLEYLFEKTCSIEKFLAGRKLFIELMLRQSKTTGIFRTEYFEKKYEAQARHNLTMALDVLG
jgi:predicted metal-dependent HD superfamily phosphohydrolase